MSFIFHSADARPLIETVGFPIYDKSKMTENKM